jgi:aminopeptidase N
LNNPCRFQTILIAIFGSITISSPTLAQQTSAKQMLYQAEYQNWLEYMERFRNHVPDTSFDVRFYDIDVDIRIDSPYIRGSVLCELDAAEENLEQIDLNLHSSLSIDSITGNIDSFTFENDTIHVILDRPYNPGETVHLTTYYQGVPVEAGGYKGLRYETHHGNQPIIATLSTPYLSHYWWPCKDGPGDKPDSVYIDIAIPDTVINGRNLIASSNGILEGVISHGGKRTFQWRERYPIVPFYVMAAISNYSHFQQIYSGGYGQSFPIDYYAFAEDSASAVQGVAQLPDVIEVFSSYFGDYPFNTEKYGMSQLGYYGAIENQTNTIQNNMSLSWFETSVHELAHMWFGDMITCRDWHHGWMNEGFATYAEALWAEHIGGIAGYRLNISQNEYYSGGTVYLEDISDPYYGVFVSIIYQKGAYVLHMLRGLMGDADFFDSLDQYSQNPAYRYGHAVTEDFQAICESVGGLDLDFFFDQWIYDEYYPIYEYGFYQDPATLETRVTIEQAQQDSGWRPVFEMPVEIEFEFDSMGDTLVTVWNDSIVQHFVFDLPEPVRRITLDPNDWILKGAHPVGVDDPDHSVVYPRFTLEQNFPNPFNPSTTIAFSLPLSDSGERPHVNLTIYDVRGRRVETLVDSDLEPGDHRIVWNGRNERGKPVSSGIYLYTLRTGGEIVTRKMTILK